MGGEGGGDDHLAGGQVGMHQLNTQLLVYFRRSGTDQDQQENSQSDNLGEAEIPRRRTRPRSPTPSKRRRSSLRNRGTRRMLRWP